MLAFPAWDCLPYDRISPNAEIAARADGDAGGAGRRLRPAGGGADHASTPRRSGCRRATVLAAASFTAEVGGRVDVAALRGYLARMGFQQAPTVTEPGEFAVRGGLIDLWPPGRAAPVRLDLFGDVLDSARRFDPETQRTTETVKRVELAPVSRGDPRRGRRSSGSAPATAPQFGAAGHDDPLYEAVSAGRKHAGLRALAAVLPRAAGDAVRLPARRAGAARRPDRRGAGGALGGARRAVRGAGGGAGREVEARDRSTSRCRRASSTSTTRPGTRRSPGGRCTS